MDFSVSTDGVHSSARFENRAAQVKERPFLACQPDPTVIAVRSFSYRTAQAMVREAMSHPGGS
jgi:hypothetical protein